MESTFLSRNLFLPITMRVGCADDPKSRRTRSQLITTTTQPHQHRQNGKRSVNHDPPLSHPLKERLSSFSLQRSGGVLVLLHYSLRQLISGPPFAFTASRDNQSDLGYDRWSGARVYVLICMSHPLHLCFFHSFRQKERERRREPSNSSLTVPHLLTIRSWTLLLSRSTCKSVSRLRERPETLLRTTLPSLVIAPS